MISNYAGNSNQYFNNAHKTELIKFLQLDHLEYFLYFGFCVPVYVLLLKLGYNVCVDFACLF